MTIAIGAHIGGFIAGLLLARPLLLWRYRRA
jgi:membrane associated rhomboid family serine protease